MHGGSHRSSIGARSRGEGDIINKDEQELELEDEIFDAITEEGESEDATDAALLDEDDADDDFVLASVDSDDLATDFSNSMAARVPDVDEDTQGDEGTQTNGEILLTQYEVDTADEAIHGDEIELDLEDALESGQTVVRAPEQD